MWMFPGEARIMNINGLMQINNEINNSQDLSGLIGGGYYLIVTDANGCSQTTDIITVNEPDPLQLTYETDEVTPVGNDGAIDLTIQGGTPEFNFSWVGPNGPLPDNTVRFKQSYCGKL